MDDDRRRLAGTVAVLTAAACFGTLGPVSRLTYDAGLEPIAFVTWRAVIGALVLLAIIALRHVRRGGPLLLRGVPPRQWVALLLATSAGFVLNLSLFVAFDRIPVALALLGFYTFPVMVAIAGVVFHGDPLGGPRLAALVLAMGGMVLVVAGQLDPAAGASLDAFGFLLALVAAASQTVFVLIGRNGYRSVPTEHASNRHRRRRPRLPRAGPRHRQRRGTRRPAGVCRCAHARRVRRGGCGGARVVPLHHRHPSRRPGPHRDPVALRARRRRRPRCGRPRGDAASRPARRRSARPGGRRAPPANPGPAPARGSPGSAGR
jgi:hypothetical protein